jgi:L-alanine-DL-glutamate epimerase-like enolase superfamily enzyme
VHELVGGTRSSIKAYASSGCSIGGYDTYVADMKGCIARGYHGYKVHPYVKIREGAYPAVESGDAERDKGLAGHLRRAAGPNALLMWDNFRSYTYEEALAVGELLHGLGYAWLESPMLEDDDACLNQYVRLCEALEIPVCAPEHYPGAHWSRLTWMQAGACDINRIDPNYGGFSGPLVLALACREAGIPLELHYHHPCEYNLQVAAAAHDGTVQYVEIFDGRPAASLDTFNKYGNGGKRPAFNCGPFHLVDPTFVGPDGMMPVPQTPGMGVEVDWETLEAKLAGDAG